MRCWLIGATALCALTSSAAAAAEYVVGLRFDDGTVEKWIQPDETATLEVFITTADDAARMKEFLIGFTASSVTPGGTLDDLGFARLVESLDSDTPERDWDYSSSVLGGPLDERILTAAAIDDNGPYDDDIPGPFTELVVDTIVIDPLPDTYSDLVTYVIEPNPLNFDVIVADRNDPAPDSFLDPAFGHVTLHVPEPSTAALLILAGVAGVFRRR